MENILEVKKLKISFRTNGGAVKAVRDISFNLEKGKTLAIVGESGSGKSVTSKAILGILAGNSIVEGGEILYDGKDLLKISEDEMYKIRGDKIAMIFQDPLSSLNPIVKIGRQITEAMLLKNKANRRQGRIDFNTLLKRLNEGMNAATDGKMTDKISEMTGLFDRFCIESNKLENAYNHDAGVAQELVASMEDFLFKASKHQKLDVRANVSEFASRLKQVKNDYLVHGFESRLAQAVESLNHTRNDKPQGDAILAETTEKALRDTEALLRQIVDCPKPNFFRIGYYVIKHPGADLAGTPAKERDEMTLKFLDEDFMKEFLDLTQKALAHSRENSLEKKRALIPVLEEAETFYKGEFTKKIALEKCKALSAQVKDAIDLLDINKDSVAYTFGSSLEGAINRYYSACRTNPKEEARYARQSAKRAKLIARGKRVDWKVVPKLVYDETELRGNIALVITRLLERYRAQLEAPTPDYAQEAVAMVDFFKDRASAVVTIVTKGMAKERAIKLMEEVGIHEPRTRFNQYPFEFSGGMRQRIVIAIALSANPDILICDEPTTALDVTIQAQILELINKLKEERHLSVIFITHDLGVVANMADDIAVMYAGKIVEYGTADDIFYDPRHPYTWALLSSMPDLDTKEKLDAIPGTPPNMIYPPEGDAFAARNKYAMKIDFEQQPPMFEVSPTHRAATWLLHPDAPKVEMPRIIVDRIQRMKEKNGGAHHGE